MKNKHFNQAIRNADLEQHIQDENARIESQVREFATTLASEGKPKIGEDRGPYNQTIDSHYEQLRFYADKELQSQEFDLLSNQDEQTTKQRQKENNKEIQQLEGWIKSHQISASRLPIDFSPWTVMFVNICIVVLTLVLAYLDARSFMAGLGENLLMGIFMGSAIALGLALFAKMTTYALRKWCRNKPQRIITFSIALGIVILVTLLIGIFRTQGANLHLEEQERQTSPIFLVLAFTILNAFIWIVEFLLTFFLLPTKEQKEQKRKRDEHLNKIKKCRPEVKRLKQENRELEQELADLRKARQQIEYYRGYITRWIDSLSKQAQSLFWAENKLFRNDDNDEQGPFTFSQN